MLLFGRGGVGGLAVRAVATDEKQEPLRQAARYRLRVKTALPTSGCLVALAPGDVPGLTVPHSAPTGGMESMR